MTGADDVRLGTAALQFHAGTAEAQGDLVDCGTSALFDITDYITFAVWVKIDAFTMTYQYVFSKGNNYMILRAGDTPYLRVVFNGLDVGDGDDYYAGGTTIPINDGQWHHVAASYDIDTGIVAFYTDGILEESNTTTGSIPVNTESLCIGMRRTRKGIDGIIDDVRLYHRTLSADDIAELFLYSGNDALATLVAPDREATDVPRDVTLSWQPGEFAAGHDVYLGTIFEDVNDGRAAVLVSQGQEGATYQPPAVLEYGRTYYWRVDEVNGAPDYTVFKGDVWSFTTEPVAYPIEGVVATSNAVSVGGAGPERTVDGSGLDADDQHSIETDDMWLATSGDDPVTIEFDFGRVCKLHEMWVWNYNSQFEPLLGFGLKDVTVESSIDGVDWIGLGDVELAQGTGADAYAANSSVELAGVAARYVRLAVNSGWGAAGEQFGLSEVRFFQIPVQAREPAPADGATDVELGAVLSWRAGREAVTHDVYLSTDSAAVSAGTAALDSVDVSSIASGGLELGATYYWKVDEVNEAETVSVWEGDLWSFSTQEFVTIEDFEGYNNESNLIYETWIDGWVNGSGSTVGYLTEPFAERSTVHGGRQSMPLEYLNSAAPYYSEAERDLGSVDLTAGGADTLRLYVHGGADNDPATLYIAVEDAAGSVAVASNPDQAVVTTEAWQEWAISLADLSGVNLAAVQVIYVGVGDRDNPTAGGSGLIFIDDIQFGRPISVQ